MSFKAPYAHLFGGMYDWDEYDARVRAWISPEKLYGLRSGDEKDDADYLRSSASRGTRIAAVTGERGATNHRLAASWNSKSGADDVLYAFVDEGDVDPQVLRGAKIGHRFASLHHRLERTPHLCFFRESTEADADAATFAAGHVRGLSDRGAWVAAVRVDAMDAPFAALVAAHEVRHLTQDGNLRSEDNEADAIAYGEWAEDVLASDYYRAGGVANAIHSCDGIPHNYETLRGTALPSDVVLASVAGEVSVYRNTGSKSYGPQWTEHWAPCPVRVA